MDPIELPVPAPFNSKVFELRHRQLISNTEGGFIQTIIRGSPIWYAEYATPALRASREHSLQAFLDSLEGSLNCFMAYDPKRPRPYAYLKGGSWGTPRVTASNKAARTLTMDQWSIGSIITPGDLLSYKIGNCWYLHRTVTGGIANSSGIVTVVVTPPPPTISSAIVMRIEKAGCAMKIIENYEAKDSVETGKSITFKAVQHMEKA